MYIFHSNVTMPCDKCTLLLTTLLYVHCTLATAVN